MFLIFYFWSWIFEKTSKFWAAPCKKASNPPAWSDHGLHRILSSYWLAHFHLMKKSAKVLLYLDCGMMDFLPASRNPKNNWCLSRIYGVRFGEKDRGLSTCKPWSEQAGRLEAFLHGAAQNVELLTNIQDQKKKLKTYSGWCPFKGLSNDTTLMQIQSGRTVPSRSKTKDEQSLQVTKL